MEEFTTILSALSDKTRLKIIWLLEKVDPELCVCEVIDALEESQYNISRHLKVLKNAGLLRTKKVGRWVFYCLINPPNQFRKFIYQAVLALPEEMLILEEERLRKRLTLRENGKCVVGNKQ
jgi:ArsR family transcriptional regulator